MLGFKDFIKNKKDKKKKGKFKFPIKSGTGGKSGFKAGKFVYGTPGKI